MPLVTIADKAGVELTIVELNALIALLNTASAGGVIGVANAGLTDLAAAINSNQMDTLIKGQQARGTLVPSIVTKTFPVSALINTVMSADFAAPAVVCRDHAFVIVNMSTVSAMTWKLRNVFADFPSAGLEHEALIAWDSVDAATALIIETCEAGWTDGGAEVSNAADAVDYKVDSNSVKFTTTADFTLGLLGYKTITAVNLTGYRFIYLWIKSDVATAAGDIVLKLDDNSDFATPLATLSFPALAAATWTRVMLPIPAVSRPNLGAVTQIGLFTATHDLGAMNINIDDITAVLPGTQEVEIPLLFNGCSTARLSIQNEAAMNAVNSGIVYAGLYEAG